MSFIYFLISFFISIQFGFLIYTGKFNFNTKVILTAAKKSIIYLTVIIILSNKMFRLKLPFQIATIQ
jgi:hypothetical protein